MRVYIYESDHVKFAFVTSTEDCESSYR